MGTASDRGQFDAARRVLDTAAQRLSACKKKSPVTDAMTQELQDARNRMQTRATWEHCGRAEVMDSVQMHRVRRCTSMMASPSSGPVRKSSKAMYCSPTRDAWIAKTPSRSSTVR